MNIWGEPFILESTQDKAKRLIDKINNPIKIEPVDIFSTEAIEDRWEEYKKKAEKDEDDLLTPEEIGLKW